mmetsp:Transcript_63164/g.175147  ORF Transcript_63164/g.175147 Transcript_63164/m.175147 type:complete len:260 (-) Transcript_63164:215-994(-)
MASESQAAIKKVLRCGDDYYNILGVDRGADDDAIKKAYRKLALRLHPDKCKEDGAEEAFKKVGEAFSVLSDAQKRQRYDQFGVEALREGGGGAPGGMSPEDIFEEFFGSHGRGIFAQGGPSFVQGGGLGGFQSVRFSTGGPGGVQFMHFSTGPGMGGPRQRRGGGGASAGPQQAESEEAPTQLPEWVQQLQKFAVRALGPFLPFVLMAVIMLSFALMGRILQFIMARAFYVFPILYLTEGRTKLVLLSSVVVLGMLGIV